MSLSIDDAPRAARGIEDLRAQRLGPVGGRWQARVVSKSETHGGSILSRSLVGGRDKKSASAMLDALTGITASLGRCDYRFNGVFIVALA